MIVRKSLKVSRIIRYTWRRMMWVVAGIGIGLVLSWAGVEPLNINVPLAILGTALAILLGFKNNNAYDRWWEARRLWGQLVNQSRNLAARVLTLPAVPQLGESPPNLGRSAGVTETDLGGRQRRIIYRHLAFVYAVKQHLRRLDPWEEVAPFVLEPAELAALRPEQHLPNALLLNQARDVRALYDAGYLDSLRHVQIDTQLAQFYDILGGCERIKNTIFPRQYTVYTDWATKIFLLLLPLTLCEKLMWLSIPFSLVLGFIYVVLAYVGNFIENPFENDINDTPISALSRLIEINLRQNLGETELPAPVQPVDGYLF